MYLIDIHPHKGGFTNQDLLRILEENWPEIIEPYALKRCVGLPDNDSDSNIKRYRQAGINTILQTPGGRFLKSMGGGITSAGNSSRIKTEVDRRKTEVRRHEELFIQQGDTIAHDFNREYGKNWDELEFKVKSFKAPVRIEEITTGEMIEI
jgi:hypothetical protein